MLPSPNEPGSDPERASRPGVATATGQPVPARASRAPLSEEQRAALGEAFLFLIGIAQEHGFRLADFLPSGGLEPDGSSAEQPPHVPTATDSAD